MYKRDKQFLSAIPPEWRDVPTGTLCDFDGETVTYVCPARNLTGGVSGAGILRKSGNAHVDYASLTPLERWIPQPGEVVAIAAKGLQRFVLITEWHGDTCACDLFGGKIETQSHHVFRIPDDFKLTPETLTVAWWQANGELYEVGDE